MSKKLILAEKPSLGREIASALGISKKNKNGFFESGDIIVASLVGHVLAAEYPKVEWSKEVLPLKDLDKPKMKPIFKGQKEDKRALTKKLIEEIKRKDVTEIVSAGDADQEGSLLVYELLEYAKIIGVKKITRMWILALDKETLKNAYEDRYDIEKDLPYVEAAKSRGLADVKVGFNFSRLFSMKGNMRGSVGRVRTATMQIIKFREDEIRNFKPEPYLNIKGEFKNSILADLIRISKDEEGKEKYSTKINIKDYEENIKNKLEKDTEYKIIEVSSKPNKKYPDLLPNQNDILKNVSKNSKVKPKEVERAMQFLYEKKFISYPRSEKRHLRVSTFDKAKTVFFHLKDLYSDNINEEKISINKENKRMFDDKKVEEHFAIIPWEKKSQSEINSLDKVQKDTYEYIVAKFLMACMNPYEYTSSNIILENKDLNLRFKATGTIENKKGFKAYKYITNKSNKQDVILPDVKEGDITTLEKISGDKEKDIKYTQPPSLLTEPDLLGVMENIKSLYKKTLSEEEEELDIKFSLGTPATRPDILESLFNVYKYMKRNKKSQVELTEEGNKLLKVVGDAITIKLTAEFEQDMKKITKSKDYAKEFDKKIDDYVNKIVKEQLPTFEYQKRISKEVNGLKCPLCKEGNLIDTGKTYRCSKSGKWDSKKKKWSGCGFSLMKEQKPIKKTLTEIDLKTLLEGKKVNGADSAYIELDLKNSFFTKVNWGDEGVSDSGNSSSNDIQETPKFYKKGGVIIWKTFSQKNITREVAERLFNGEKVRLTGLKSRAGKKYEATVYLKEGKITFE